MPERSPVVPDRRAQATATATWVRRTAAGTWEGSLETNRWSPRRTHRLRETTSVFAQMEFRAKYRAQSLGLVWSVLRPLVTMSLLTFVFRASMGTQADSYPIFVLMGVVFWQFVSRTWTTATHHLVQLGDVVRFASLPRHLLVVGSVVSSVVTSAIECGVLLVLLPFFPSALHFGSTWLLLPLVAACAIALLLGLSLATSALNAYYRDIGYAVEMTLSLAYWLTPIFYPLDFLPHAARTLVQLNPLAALLLTGRGILTHDVVDRRSLVVSVVSSVVVLALGALVYRRHAHELPDQL